jgi:hypothetical protein
VLDGEDHHHLHTNGSHTHWYRRVHASGKGRSDSLLPFLWRTGGQVTEAEAEAVDLRGVVRRGRANIGCSVELYVLGLIKTNLELGAEGCVHHESQEREHVARSWSTSVHLVLGPRVHDVLSNSRHCRSPASRRFRGRGRCGTFTLWAGTPRARSRICTAVMTRGSRS